MNFFGSEAGSVRMPARPAFINRHLRDQENIIMIYGLIVTIHIIVCLFIIIVVLLQSGI